MKTNKPVLALSLPLAALVILVSYVGLYTPGFYSTETVNWQAQAVGQDLVDLVLIVPTLLTATFFAYRNNRAGLIVWAGVAAYLLYTFAIYCFNLHFNQLFVAYCFVLGLSFYSFAYFLLSLIKELFKGVFNNPQVIKVTGIYFLIISLVFYFLWFSEIIPAILSNTTPKTLVESGLFTNPVQVMDLSIFLPGIFLVGLLALKRNTLGLVIAPTILVFVVLMDVTIGTLVAVMNNKGLENGLAVTYIMGVLAVFSLTILIWYLKSIKANGRTPLGVGAHRSHSL